MSSSWWSKKPDALMVVACARAHTSVAVPPSKSSVRFARRTGHDGQFFGRIILIPPKSPFPVKLHRSPYTQIQIRMTQAVRWRSVAVVPGRLEVHLLPGQPANSQHAHLPEVVPVLEVVRDPLSRAPIQYNLYLAAVISDSKSPMSSPSSARLTPSSAKRLSEEEARKRQEERVKARDSREQMFNKGRAKRIKAWKEKQRLRELSKQGIVPDSKKPEPRRRQKKTVLKATAAAKAKKHEDEDVEEDAEDASKDDDNDDAGEASALADDASAVSSSTAANDLKSAVSRLHQNGLVDQTDVAAFEEEGEESMTHPTLARRDPGGGDEETDDEDERHEPDDHLDSDDEAEAAARKRQKTEDDGWGVPKRPARPARRRAAGTPAVENQAPRRPVITGTAAVTPVVPAKVVVAATVTAQPGAPRPPPRTSGFKRPVSSLRARTVK